MYSHDGQKILEDAERKLPTSTVTYKGDEAEEDRVKLQSVLQRNPGNSAMCKIVDVSSELEGSEFCKLVPP